MLVEGRVMEVRRGHCTEPRFQSVFFFFKISTLELGYVQKARFQSVFLISELGEDFFNLTPTPIFSNRVDKPN